MKLGYFTSAFGRWVVVQTGDKETRPGLRSGNILIRPGYPLSKVLKYLAAVGYKNVAICSWVGHSAYPSCLDKDDREDLKRLVRDLGLTITGIGAHGGSRHVFDRNGYLTRSEAEREERIAYTKAAIDLASDLGVGLIDDVVGELPAGMEPESGWNVVTETYKRLCSYAEGKGVVIGLELYLGFVHTPESFLSLVEKVNSSALRCTLDPQNLITAKMTDIDSIVKMLQNHIVHVHIKGLTKENKLTRPGGPEDVFDITGFVRSLASIGYDGALTLEEYPDLYMPEGDPYQCAKEAYRDLSKKLAPLGVLV